MTRSSDMPGPRAELAAFAAKLNAIFERGREEALNPTNPELRAWNDANYAAQHDGGAGIGLGGIAREQHSELQSDGSDRTHLRSAVNSAGIPEGDSMPTNSCTGIAEAKAAAAIHWKNKRRAA